ncbi:hypothetical protein EX30DRAFT_117579 [Ascodesmis nigricans]|uniref:Uncharacterized protein n=1 Tax=Ascodesmis nigricans TaxID=341454 RepID=A0A4S2MSP6_9PEZI|nr:hypothetical protein EX30DRAFT_117579 [Ascodesmis nigricans]
MMDANAVRGWRGRCLLLSPRALSLDDCRYRTRPPSRRGLVWRSFVPWGSRFPQVMGFRSVVARWTQVRWRELERQHDAAVVCGGGGCDAYALRERWLCYCTLDR